MRWSMTDPRTQIDNLLDRIVASDALTDDDRDLLRRFSRRLDLLSNKYSDYRHLKLLGHCFRTASNLEGPVLAPALGDEAAAERMIAWVNANYDNEETNRDYRTALRVFGKRVTDGDDIPNSLEWIPTGTSATYDPSPDPRDMLEWADDVVPMAEAATNPRDAAMIAMQFDAGLRGSEFFDLSLGDVQDHEYGRQVTVEGKTGRRSVVLVNSVPYVSEWEQRHPRSADPEAPLWADLSTGSEISRQRIYQALQALADRADIDKPVTPTNLRKSSAAYLARQNVNQVHIEEHHGWVRGSRVAARYIAVFGEDTDREIARAQGIDVDAEDPQPQGPIECPRCGQQTPRGRDFCIECNQALVPGAAEIVDELTNVLDEQLIEADDPEERRDLLSLRNTTRENPGVLDADEVHQVLTSLSD